MTTQSITNLDPTTGNASTITNQSVNYGWEYVWHCHILGHEENDMMRSIAVATAPETPSNASPIDNGTNVVLNFTDNSIVANWVKITRYTDKALTNTDKTVNLAIAECASQSGCPVTYTDSVAPNISLYYTVSALNTVGSGDINSKLPTELASTLTNNFLGYDNVTATSAGQLLIALDTPTLSAATTALTFNATEINATSGVQPIVLSANGRGTLAINPTVTGQLLP